MPFSSNSKPQDILNSGNGKEMLKSKLRSDLRLSKNGKDLCKK